VSRDKDLLDLMTTSTDIARQFRFTLSIPANNDGCQLYHSH
jgi:hypothetical protein